MFPFVPVFEGVLSDRRGWGRCGALISHSSSNDPTAVPVLCAQEPAACWPGLCWEGTAVQQGGKGLEFIPETPLGCGTKQRFYPSFKLLNKYLQIFIYAD